MSTILVPSGPDTQINTDTGGGTGVPGAQQFPQITALIDGRFAVVYQSPSFGNAADNDIIARFVNPDGSLAAGGGLLAGAGQQTAAAGGGRARRGGGSVVLAAAGQQTAPAVAGRPGGGFGVVFTDERHADGTVDPNGTNITYRTVSAAGAPATPLAIADLNGGIGQDALQAPAIATLQSGRQVVVFERVVSGTASDVYLNVVNAAGTATDFSAAAPLVVTNTVQTEADPATAANGENALIIYEAGVPGSPGQTVINLRLFNGQTNTLGPELRGIDLSLVGSNPHFTNPAAIALDGTRYAVAFQDDHNVYSAIYDPAVPGFGGISVLSQMRIVASGGSNPSLARTPDGGFVVSWTEPNGGNLDVHARVFTAAGEPAGGFGDFGIPVREPLTLGTLTDAVQDFSFVATSADHAFFAWQDGGVRPADGTPTGVDGMMFQMFKVSAHSDVHG